MRITESQLRKIIREELSRLGDFSAVEKFDSSYYTLKVSHPETINFPSGDSITAYDTSELRASIRDGIMEIVSVYVHKDNRKDYRGKKLATQMIRQAIEWGHSRGYEVVGSGVYSAGGSGLAKSFLEKGEAQADPQLGKHKFLKRV